MASARKTAVYLLLLAAIGGGGVAAGRATAPEPPAVTPTIITEIVYVTPEPTKKPEEATETRSYPVVHNYVASRSSDKFHEPWCSYAGKIKEENRVYFETRQDAIDSGKDPCSRCNP